MTAVLQDRAIAERVFAPPNALSQAWVLMRRLIAPALRNGEIWTAVASPVVFTIGFYIPLVGVMTFLGAGSSGYGQFLMPMIVLQGVAFSAIAAAFRSATDAVQGINRRFSAMPIADWVPVAARMGANLFRCTLTVISATICGHLIGFRFHLSAWHTVGFLALTMTIGFVLSLGADVIGSLTRSPEATSQALILPQMVFGMLSTGFAPSDQFPSWIAPFVRNQPVSQMTFLMRALAGDTSVGAGPTWAMAMPALLWLGAGTIVFIPLAVKLSSRRL